MVKETDTGDGSAWLAWPRTLGALPNSSTSLVCPPETKDVPPYCIAPRSAAGRLCHTTPGCTGVAVTTDNEWNKQFPSSCMLTAGIPVPSGLANSSWNVKSWASYTRPIQEGDTNAGNFYTWNIPKSCSMEVWEIGCICLDHPIYMP